MLRSRAERVAAVGGAAGAARREGLEWVTAMCWHDADPFQGEAFGFQGRGLWLKLPAG